MVELTQTHPAPQTHQAHAPHGHLATIVRLLLWVQLSVGSVHTMAVRAADRRAGSCGLRGAVETSLHRARRRAVGKLVAGPPTLTVKTSGTRVGRHACTLRPPQRHRAPNLQSMSACWAHHQGYWSLLQSHLALGILKTQHSQRAPCAAGSARPVPVVGCVRSVLRVHDPCGTRFRAGRCGTDEAAILTGTPGLAPRRGDSPAPPQPVMMAPPLAHEGCTRSRNRAIRRAAGVAESADGQRLTRARVAPGLRPLAPARAAVAAGRLVDRMQAWPPVRVERSARRRTADTRCARARRTR